MAISDKLTYLNGTKTKIREGLNSLGADLDTEDTFRSYVDAIDEIYEDYPKITGEGESLSLDNTKQASMQIDYKGNTSQETYTGKNLLHQDLYIATETKNGITYTNNGDGTFNVTGTATANTNIPILTGDSQVGLVSGKTYYLYSSQPYNSTTFNLSIPFSQDGTQKYLRANNTTTTSGTITNVKLTLWIDSGTTVNAQNVKLMLVEGSSAGDYEPYVGGTTSPNPSYPQPINVVSGDNTIDIVGKNLFNLYRNNGSANGFNLVVNEDKTVTITGGSSTVTYFNLHNGQLPIKSNTTYTVSGAVSSSAVLRIRIFDENGTSVYSQFLSNKLTFTTPSNGVKYDLYIVLYASQTSVTYKPQLELGDTATTYEPYIGHSYPIQLGDIELCKIGTYQDYIYKDNGSWYLHKEIGKVVLDGTQNITQATSGIRRFNATYTTLGLTNIKDGTGSYNSANYRMCDHFIHMDANHTSQLWGIYYLYNNWLVMFDTESVIADANALKTWFTNNNTTIYYVLATPTNTLIEDTTLIEQLEESKLSYISQTNISQENNDLPFILSVKALRGE